MTTFLADARTYLQSAIHNGEKVTFVIGNESAGMCIEVFEVFEVCVLTRIYSDLDSLTSTLLLAYIRTYCPRPNAFSAFCIPLLNIPASDIAIRSEFLALLPYANLDSESLITLTDLPKSEDLVKRLPPENTSWILVDHNAFQGMLGKLYAGRVAGTIDHHNDERMVPTDTGAEPRIITQTGSCTSLVTNYCHEAWDSLADTKPETHDAGDLDIKPFLLRWDAMIAQFALASILIDTNNLTSKDKTTEHDTSAFAYLESKVMGTLAVSALYKRDKYFDEIKMAQQDVSGLKLRDMLRKDYKEWTEGSLKLGVSSVVKSVDYLVQKAVTEQTGSPDAGSESFLETTKRFAGDRSLDIYAVMAGSTSAEGKFQRELLVWAFNPDGELAAKQFEKISSDKLGLRPWHGSACGIEEEGKGEWRKIWQQNEVQHTRKRVGPLLREAMS
jgi:exopolyphosphatase